MLTQMRQLLGSIINSYLGPYKSYKLVIDGQESCMLKCPLLILQNTIIKDPFSSVVESALSSHHDQYGCTTASLLAMWYLWHEEFQLALQEGCEIADIVQHSQKILDEVILLLSEITIYCDKTLLPKQIPIRNTSAYNSCKFSGNEKPFKELVKTSNILGSTSNHFNIGVGYSSRHFSPFQSKFNDPQENCDEFENLSIESTPKNVVCVDSNAKQIMHSLVEKLCHDETDFTNLICDLWVKQVESEQTMKFSNDGIIICVVALPCSYSTVVGGLIIKSNLSSLYDQDSSNFQTCRALIIRGSILYEYVHLGYVSKVSVKVKKTAEDLKVSEKDSWSKECCGKLSELQINVLLVSGEVDQDILSFCSCNNILVLPRIPWSTLQIICNAVNEYPCTYLVDCDEDNVIPNLDVKKWNFEYNKMLKKAQYYHIDIKEVNDMKKPHTVIICHPSESILSSLEHQFGHVASRLYLALKGNRLLPGGGKTEEFCYNSIQKNTSEIASERRIRTAVSNGFMNYFKIISNKAGALQDEDQACLDEMQSKVEAWRSAMSLALVIMQCDNVIISDPDSQIVKELNQNVIGYL